MPSAPPLDDSMVGGKVKNKTNFGGDILKRVITFGWVEKPSPKIVSNLPWKYKRLYCTEEPLSGIKIFFI